MYKVSVDHVPSENENAIISKGVLDSSKKETGLDSELMEKPFSVFLRDDSGKIHGGILATYDAESVYISLLWVDEKLRGQGHGSKLLVAAEQEAQKNGCIYSKVDTWSFQAEGFYLKNGYKKMGEIKNYWLTYSKIFFRKKLSA